MHASACRFPKRRADLGAEALGPRGRCSVFPSLRNHLCFLYHYPLYNQYSDSSVIAVSVQLQHLVSESGDVGA